MGSRLEIQSLRKSFGHTVILQDLNLAIENGKFVSLLGPSGCGKTTTLNIIAGFFDPDQGSVKLDGVDITYQPSYRRGVSMVFQSYALFPHMNVADNISFSLRMRGGAKHEIAHRVAEMLELVRLPGVENRFPRQLSGGQQQRIGLARALAARPGLLLLDEPLSNLDARLRRQMQTELRQILDRVGTTTLYVTHDQEEAMTMSHRIVVMNHGRVEQIGTPREIFCRPRTQFVAELLGESNFVQGVVMGGDSAHATVSLSNGHVVAAQTHGERVASGSKVLLMTRPISIRVSRGHKGLLSGNVTACAFAGDLLRIEVLIQTLGVFRCEAAATETEALPTGSEVHLLIRDQDWQIVDA